MEHIFYFFLWTFVIYLMHITVHIVPGLKTIHRDHHKFITENDGTTWSWNNVFLFNDTWMSTADLWITEVVPTMLFCWVTGHWWIALFYYVWAAFVQEQTEHNKKVDLYPFLTAGKWHLVHHRIPNRNYGLFIPLWDQMFNTEYKGVVHGIETRED